MTDSTNEVFPCGCLARYGAQDDGLMFLTFVPCRQGCPTHLALIAVASERNLAVEPREAP